MTAELRPFNFLGLSARESAYDSAQAVIMPVAYEGTVSYGGGTAGGPSAIIAASREVETFDRIAQKDLGEIGIASLDELQSVALSPEAMVNSVYEEVEQHLKRDKKVIMIGGEHSLTFGSVRAHAAKFPNLSVLQIDAHADLRDSYQGSRFSHASVMRRVHECCPAVAVGIRNISAEGHQFAREQSKTIFYSEQTVGRVDWYEMCFEALGDTVYITIDLDALDPSIMPAVGTPEPGGFSYEETIAFLREVFKRCDVVGCDVVELAPIPGMHAPDFLAAKLVAFLCAGLAGWWS